jgi:hypothetical protein
MNAHMAKPISTEALCAVLERFLGEESEADASMEHAA